MTSSTSRERTLGEGREGADALDLVAEELDPERLAAGGRKDVDEAAANRDLAALLDPVDPLVACEHEGLGEAVDPRLVSAGHVQRGRPLARAAAPARASASAEAQTRPPRASTSSARARSPTRCGGGSSPEPRRTPREGSSADALLAEEPAGRLGRVARVGVLRHEHAEAASELLVERCEQERRARLGDPGSRRQRRRERGQALVGAEALDERIEERAVHASRMRPGNARPVWRPGAPRRPRPGSLR